MSNKEKFLKLVTATDTSLISEVNDRIKNREMLRESQNIALMVLEKLDDLNWTQKRLANAIGVSPQQVTKIVSGKENLTIESMVKLEQVLGIALLAKPAHMIGSWEEHDAPMYKSSLSTYTVHAMEDSVQYGTAKVVTQKSMRIPKSKFQLA